MPEKKHKHLIRALTVTDQKVDVDSRTIEFSFSSELPYPRWFGIEVLSHAPGACDLSRMKNGANALFNHDMDFYIGVVEDASIGNDRRGYCRMRFAQTPDAARIMQDVSDGILRNVSVGYEIKDLVLTRQGQDGQDPEYTATEWMPYEVSFVTIPADPTVGVGRSAETCENKRLLDLIAKANRVMSTENSGAIVAPTVEQSKESENKPAAESAIKETEMPQAEEVKAPKVDVKAEREGAAKAERERAKAITAMCERHDVSSEAQKLIEDGTSISDARAVIMDKLASRTQSPVTDVKAANIGMTDKEVKRYSFINVIRALANPNDKRMQEAAAFEREVSETAQTVTGKAARGFLAPFDVLQRDLQVAVPAQGGNLVAQNLLSGSFIDILRNKSALTGAGAQILTGLNGNLQIPRQIGASTVAWVGEGQDVPESDLIFDQVPLSPKTIGGFVEYTRKLMLQSSIDIEALIRADLAESIALGIDRAALYGTGTSNQPRGVKNQTGINTVTPAAGYAYGDIVQMETVIEAANADIGAMKYIFGAAARGALKTTLKAPANPSYLIDDAGIVNGYGSVVSNQIDANDVFFGVWSQLIMGFWSGLDITVDPYTKATSGNVRVVAMQDCDIAVRQPKAFAFAHFGS